MNKEQANLLDKLLKTKPIYDEPDYDKLGMYGQDYYELDDEYDEEDEF